jgi:GH15 family glucan-1,4-alpha-glucosidase
MPLPIEDYALIGDTQTAALVGKDGSIDWLCLPRFDSGACFAALLGDASNGRWLLAPKGKVRKVTRRYEPGTLILVTEFVTDDGAVEVVDCMPPRDVVPDLVRFVRGIRGQVEMMMDLVIRFEYGSVVPWVSGREKGVLDAVAGPNGLRLQSGALTTGRGLTTVANFTVRAGESVPFLLGWYPSHQKPPNPIDPDTALQETRKFWQDWVSQCTYAGEWREPVLRSLITLKALTYAPTGGIVAAPTTALPERIGGVRNWDYRYCWIRDATFTLYALLTAGFRSEATAWRDWLLRAVAGDPSQLQIVYGTGGERSLWEIEIPWLRGYEGSLPVRVGNAAVHQFQLDVYGELLDTMHQARKAGIATDERSWALERALLRFLETGWKKPDAGVWEMRGEPRHFTHSKVMAWVGFDRAVKAIEKFGQAGPLEKWQKLRDRLKDEICERGYDRSRNTFTQFYGSEQIDAALLMMPLVGFLPPTDERIRGTVRAIERDLMHNGFVDRYSAEESEAVDGLPGGEGSFLPCSFWLADNYALGGRLNEARALFERLLEVRNDVGLLSEEYDPEAGRLLGNFPQAFSHVGLINTAQNLSEKTKPAESRKE